MHITTAAVRRLLALSTVSFAALAGTPACSQETSPQQPAAATANAPGQETSTPLAQEAPASDIIVTANRIETRLSDTPLAITAITGDQLVSRGVTTAQELADEVPNVAITGNQTVQITIRGVTSSDATEKGDPAAAFNVDGIYIARPQSLGGSFYDLERIEVLRGPQGTLYGRNTTAGVVNVISARPRPDFGASADVSYASFDHVYATGVLNVPVGDTFALRAAVNYDRRDGYAIKRSADRFSWGPVRDAISGRLGALIKPASNFRAYLKADYARDTGFGIDGSRGINFFTDVRPGCLTCFPVYRKGLSSDQRRENNLSQLWQGTSDVKGWGLTSELTWDVSESLSLTNLSGYREQQIHQRGNGNTSPTTGNRTTFDAEYSQWSNEFRVAYNAGPVNFQTGVYLFGERSNIAFFLLDLLGPGVNLGFPQRPTLSDSKGVFGQLTYSLTDRLKLTGGIRYSSDDKSRRGQTVADNSVTNTRSVISVNDAARTFNSTTWRAGVDYDVPGLGLLYATVSTGYRAGGFNDGCEAGTAAGCALPASSLYYNPEEITSYEGGFKVNLLDRLIGLTGSAFHYDYTGLQISQLVINGCGQGANCQITTNAGAAKIDGVELEGQLRPARNHEFYGSATYTDARYTDYLSSLGSYRGFQLNRSPKTVFTARYTFTHPLAGGSELSFSVRGRFSSSFALYDLGNGNLFRQPDYTKTDLNLTYTAPDRRWYVSAFANNLEDAIVLTGVAADTPTGLGGAAFEEPRVFGVRSGFRF